ncbi:hypothetical protein [Stenotrophomonas sp. GD03958]|uniref:hypothetical protein n=1 Tax=Stenotrophomonas sp. GD03958 TaxID=2975411 RepID=UPI0024488C05|nr:hypothetical protein [Stenotrophomonas sp. GD03958]MDH1192491.1 hypothetical protein [Stenotrophomonas sp. GD03958]
MSSKHTPGPWHVTQYHPFCSPINGKGDRVTFAIRDSESDVAYVHTMLKGLRTDEANARLIAAAPQLLEALSKAVRETEQFLFDAWLVRVCPSGDVESVQRQWLASSDHREFVDEWREQIDAIAKATGGAQ